MMRSHTRSLRLMMRSHSTSVPHNPATQKLVLITATQTHDEVTLTVTQAHDEVTLNVSPTHPPARGTCESRCLVSGVTTDPEPCGFARPRLAVRGFPGEKGILVVEPSPGYVSAAYPSRALLTLHVALGATGGTTSRGRPLRRRKEERTVLKQSPGDQVLRAPFRTPSRHARPFPAILGRSSSSIGNRTRAASMRSFSLQVRDSASLTQASKLDVSRGRNRRRSPSCTRAVVDGPKTSGCTTSRGRPSQRQKESLGDQVLRAPFRTPSRHPRPFPAILGRSSSSKGNRTTAASMRSFSLQARDTASLPPAPTGAKLVVPTKIMKEAARMMDTIRRELDRRGKREEAATGASAAVSGASVADRKMSATKVLLEPQPRRLAFKENQSLNTSSIQFSSLLHPNQRRRLRSRSAT
ncbi:uncharacterized protein ISCGN_001272 [Ixodes scapularis]